MKYKVINNGNKARFELYEGDKIIGYCETENNIIDNIFIFDEYRKVSYGRSLLFYVINELSKQNYDEVIIKKYNDKYLSFFTKHGFVKRDDELIVSGLNEINKQKHSILKASFVSFIINLLLTLLKLSVGYVFSLSSIIADGINSAGDCITSIISMFGIKITNDPEDKEHPFGHGKIESIFSLIIGIMIFLSTLGVLIDNIKKIFYNELPVFNSNEMLVYGLTAFFIVLKLVQYLYIKVIATRYENKILLTLLKDYLADILITSSVLVGVILTYNFSRYFDILLGIAISIYILYNAYNIIYENIMTLLETQDEEFLLDIKKFIASNKDIYFVHDLFMISSGKNVYIYADVRMKEDLNIKLAHEIVEGIGIELRQKYPNIIRVTLHIEPIY